MRLALHLRPRIAVHVEGAPLDVLVIRHVLAHLLERQVQPFRQQEVVGIQLVEVLLEQDPLELLLRA